MAKIKKSYGALSIDEMRDEESALRTALFNLRVENTTKALENTSKIRDAKRELARVLTALRAKQIAEAGEAAGAAK